MSPTDVTAHAPDPWSTPERVALRRLARDFVAREIAPNMAEWERDGELPRDLHRKAAGAGLLGVGLHRAEVPHQGFLIDGAVLVQEVGVAQDSSK